MKYVLIASALICGIHAALLLSGYYSAWVIYNLLIGFFLFWIAYLIQAERDSLERKSKQLQKTTEKNSAGKSTDS